MGPGKNTGVGLMWGGVGGVGGWRVRRRGSSHLHALQFPSLLRTPCSSPFPSLRLSRLLSLLRSSSSPHFLPHASSSSSSSASGLLFAAFVFSNSWPRICFLKRCTYEAALRPMFPFLPVPLHDPSSPLSSFPLPTPPLPHTSASLSPDASLP